MCRYMVHGGCVRVSTSTVTRVQRSKFTQVLDFARITAESLFNILESESPHFSLQTYNAISEA